MSKQLAEALEAHQTAQKREALKNGWGKVPEWVFTGETASR